jgi:transcriptional regulator with XRE-family HTH domain
VTRESKKGELKMYEAMDGPKVRTLREERGMTLPEFAEVAGLGESTVRNVEKGANLRLRTVRNVAATFGMRPQELGRPVGGK